MTSMSDPTHRLRPAASAQHGEAVARHTPQAGKVSRTEALQAEPSRTQGADATPGAHSAHALGLPMLAPWRASSLLDVMGLSAVDNPSPEGGAHALAEDPEEAPAETEATASDRSAEGMRVISQGRARPAGQPLATRSGSAATLALTPSASAASPAGAGSAPTSPARGPGSPAASAPSPTHNPSEDVATRWPSGSALAKARQLPDVELVRELAEVRRALSERRTGEPRDASYHALRAAQTELEFEARRRTDVVGGQALSLDPMATATPLSFTEDPLGSATTRAVVLRKLDYAIATMGLEGAERAISALPDTHEGSPASNRLMTWLRQELASRRVEGQAFLERFEQVGRAIALGLLGESAARLQAELARYGLRQGSAASDGSLRGMGLAPGEKGAAISEMIAHGQAIRAAYDRARAHPEAGRAAWDDFERTKARAITAHPILASFLAGETALAKAAPTGLVPEATELGAQSPALLAGMIGWELNQKLADNRATREHLASGALSIFGAPRVVELTKLEMRVAEGMMLSGVVDERVRNPPGAPWTETLASALTVALGLLLAVPTGGASAGLAMAGNLTLLAGDLYLIGKGAAERAIPNAAANTDLTVEQSLIDEEPSAAPLIHQLLGGLGLATGTLGVIQSAAHLQVVSLARQSVADMKQLRRTLGEHGADAMHAEVRAIVARVRAIGQKAGLPEAQLEAMIRTALRGGGSSAARRVAVGLDHAAQVTDETAATLAERLGVPRVVRTAERGGRVSLRLTQSGPLAVEQLEVATDATVGDILMHKVTLDALRRYRGALGKVRELRDRVAALLRREGKAGQLTAASRNPHLPRTRGHELFEEVRKHEAAVESRLSALLAYLDEGGDASKRAACALEDQIGVLEGELSYYRSALAEAEATGNLGMARGVIESPGDAGRAAAAKGYEPAPDGYHYQRNRYQPEEYVIARNAGRDDLPPLQVNKEGERWSLGPADEARRQRIFYGTLGDGEVLEAMIDGSPSWRLYQETLIDPSKVGLDAAQVRQRSLRAIEQARTPRGRWSRGKADLNEDLIRRALKEEFRADIVRAVLAKPTREEQVMFLRKVTDGFGFTNAADKGNLFEELLAGQDPSLLRHAVMDQAQLAGRNPPVHISKDRVVDLLGSDGTLIEVKAVKTKMGREQEEQLKDYLAVRRSEADLPYKNGMVMTKRLVYAFMEPEGVLANQSFIQEALKGGGIIRVYNKAGFSREFSEDLSTIQDVMTFAVSTAK